MRGLNVVVLSGNVNKIDFAETLDRGDQACTFSMAIEKSKDKVTWVRVNVFGPEVSSCRSHLRKGMGVAVQGELMNRYVSEKMVMEVRATDIKFLS